MRKKKHNKTPQPLQTAGHEDGRPNGADEVANLKSEIERLRKELDFEKLKSEAYSTMIDIAEKKFSIPIRKKRGANSRRPAGKGPGLFPTI